MSKADRDESLYKLVWPVAREGYELQHVKGGNGGSLLSNVEYDRIRALPGPEKTYWPLTDYPGLWLILGNQCFTVDDALAFVGEFGLLSGAFDDPEWILNVAELIRQIVACLDRGDRALAAELFSKYAKPSFTARIVEKGGKFDTELVPTTLHAAILLQALDTITSHRVWRRCQNGGCREWFKLGPGESRTRRKFCTDRCRVAAARHKKKEADNA